MTAPIPTFVLGGTGYVAGELMRLLIGHPIFEIAGVLSASQAQMPIREVFPQLQDHLGQQVFLGKEELFDRFGQGRAALFSAAPHGVSAALVAAALARAERQDCALTVVDVSADFRFAQADAYAAVYGQAHGAPELLPEFRCALPEHVEGSPTAHIGHPGCFATALLIGAVPLLELDLIDGPVHAFGVTGSTGSGRGPTATTHHPERHANLFAYKPLAHRHAPEVVELCESLTGRRPQLHFVPHSGPFARGIHMSLQARLKKPADADALRAAFAGFYSRSPFVTVHDRMPHIKDVAGSNYCHLGLAADDQSIAVFTVIDNLVKGAAGGAIQWMNRQFGIAEHTGLTAPATGWG